MSLIKCKMCGGELNVKENEQLVTCDYCGSTQTIPVVNDERILKLIARGNNLRINKEFDKAYNIFEQLILEDGKNAENYWNLLLCKYGITYVDDYDGKKIPTINRMSPVSILDDDDFKKTKELADVVTRSTYIDEATKIAEIQKRINDIMKTIEPFDVFISYKETDEFGDRTKDSILAQEIYETLTKEGLKVFLSRITLSSVAGSEYEPYIYSALYTSKLMILVTTSEDYVNAVWVKNEWSRFLAMMKNDTSKKLIPCYKDMDAYDLPKELRNIQGLDMSKLGFIQDLLVGVRKILHLQRNEPIHQKYEEQPRDVSRKDVVSDVKQLIKIGKIQLATKKLEELLIEYPTNPYVLIYNLFFEEEGNDEDMDSEFSEEFEDFINFKDLKILRSIPYFNTNKYFIQALENAEGELKEKLEGLIKPTMEIKDNVLINYYSNDKELIVPDGVTTIGKDAAFSLCSLEKVTLPSSIITIENGAFQNCINLSEINLENVQVIDTFAFKGTKLTKVVLDKIVKLGSFIFGDYIETLIVNNTDIIFPDSGVYITQSKNIQYIKAPWQIICTAGAPGSDIKKVEYLPTFNEFSDKQLNSTCHYDTVQLPSTFNSFGSVSNIEIKYLIINSNVNYITIKSNSFELFKDTNLSILIGPYTTIYNFLDRYKDKLSYDCTKMIESSLKIAYDCASPEKRANLPSIDKLGKSDDGTLGKQILAMVLCFAAAIIIGLICTFLNE